MRSGTFPSSTRPRARAVWLGLGLSLLATGCTFFGGDPTTTTSTTAATSTTTTTIAFPDRSTTSTTLAPGVDPDVAAALDTQIAALLREAEGIRGLQFVEKPAVVVLSDADFRTALSQELALEIDAERLATDERVFRMLGMLADAFDLPGAVADAFDVPYVAFYDADAFQLVVSGESADLTALDRTAIFHELVHALTDQYFDATGMVAALGRADRTDAASALEALVEGDATYFQLVYTQGLDDIEQAAISTDLDAVAGRPVTAGPGWLIEDLAFPYDIGLEFVKQLVSRGGIAELDRAYLDPPVSTEHMLHPERYRVGETLRPLPELAVSLEGYQIARTGALGEWGLRLLLTETLPPGLLTQTVDGWGADAFATLRSSTDVAFVYTFAADTQDDAIEVAVALVEHARTSMGAGNGINEDGGILFDEGGPWVFVDRVGDGLMFIAATNAAAGRLLRGQVIVP